MKKKYRIRPGYVQGVWHVESSYFGLIWSYENSLLSETKAEDYIKDQIDGWRDHKPPRIYP